MSSGVQPQRRKPAARKLKHASGPVIESLENRLLMARHTRVAAPHASNLTDNFLIGNFGASPAQISHLYGLDALDAANGNFPLYTNQGPGQVIVIVGAAAPQLNDVPMGRKSNINQFSSQYGFFQKPVFEDVAPGEVGPGGGGGGGGGGGLFDPVGALESTAQLEWAHAMAPNATLCLVEIDTVNGVATPQSMANGLNEAVNVLDGAGAGFSTGGGGGGGGGGFTGFLNTTNTVGGVVSLAFTTTGEDAATASTYDSIINRRGARYVSFIAPAGNTGGVQSMPATSPYVTSVGGTVYTVDAAGNRISETAWLNSGGGQSGVEPLPAYQNGVTVNGKALTSRGSPDLVIAGIRRGNGLDVYYDPTMLNDAIQKHYSIQGTGGGAAIFAGMIADANELRQTLGLSLLGRGLNAQLYQVYKRTPNLNFTDIIQGNNTLYQAFPGYDLATGMGAPKADALLPALAEVVSSETVNLTFTGQQYAAIGQPIQGNAVTPFRGTGILNLGTQFATLNLPILSVDGLSTATLNIPTVTRGLDNSLKGQGTVTVVNVSKTTPPVSRTTVYTVKFVGQVTVSGHLTGITGQIFTVDAFGNRLKPGLLSIFEGTFASK